MRKIENRPAVNAGRQFLLGALVLLVPGVGGAQGAKVATRQLGAAASTSTELLGSVANVRQLPNGNVLVNDQARRRVVMLDKDLKLVSVVADSTSMTGNAYGARPGGLIPYRGDSTLFVEPVSLSMLVIDPAGKIVRTMAAPRPNDVNFLASPAFGFPGFDSQGRLVYRVMDFGFRGGRGPQPGQPFTPPTPPDSAALVRFDLASRKLDTASFVKLPKNNVSMTQNANGGMSFSITTNPLPVVDDWAVMSDGTIAIARGQDYHIDFVEPTGVRRAEKIPYEWQRMTDDDKQRVLDSAKVAIEKARAAAQAAGPGAEGAQRAAEIGALVGGGGGPQQMVNITVMRGGDGPMPPQRGGGGPGAPGGGAPGEVRVMAGGPGGMQMPAVNMVPASELPDYKPVFGQNSLRADMDGRVWLRTIPTKPTPGGAIYDVIDKTGKLVDRVQVPAGTTIAGFGAGGVVYLGMRDKDGLHLQRITHVPLP